MSEHDKTGAVETESLMPKYTVTDVETQAIQYYNKTYPMYGSSGKYIIYQGETTVMDNVCHVMLRFQQGSSISDPVADIYMNLYTGECKVCTRTVVTPKPHQEKSSEKARFKFIYIIALVLLLNIVFIPFISDENGLIVDSDDRVRAYSFGDMLEALGDDYSSNDDAQIDVLYYIGGSICALVVFIGAIGKASGACIFGSVCGIALTAYIFYQFFLGTTTWYIGLSEAHLTFGYYMSCIGFITTFIASLNKKQE